MQTNIAVHAPGRVDWNVWRFWRLQYVVLLNCNALFRNPHFFHTFLGLRAAAAARGGRPDIRLGGVIRLAGRLGLGAGVCFSREVCDGRVVWGEQVFHRTLVPTLDGLRVCLQGQSCRTDKGKKKARLFFDNLLYVSFLSCQFCFVFNLWRPAVVSFIISVQSPRRHFPINLLTFFSIPPLTHLHYEPVKACGGFISTTLSPHSKSLASLSHTIHTHRPMCSKTQSEKKQNASCQQR